MLHLSAVHVNLKLKQGLLQELIQWKNFEIQPDLKIINPQVDVVCLVFKKLKNALFVCEFQRCLICSSIPLCLGSESTCNNCTQIHSINFVFNHRIKAKINGRVSYLSTN